MEWPFGDLERGRYAAILADPPWNWRSWGSFRQQRSGTAPKGGRETSKHYGLMDTDELAGLPVSDLAAPDCVLFMWFSWPMLPEALSLISAWSFEYKTCAFSWMKANGAQIAFPFQEDITADMKLGYWTRANSEACLLATRGAPKRLHADVRQGVIEPAREHSRKPDCVYGRIERLVAGPYLELFARSTRAGWSSWGNQVGKFGRVAAE